MKKIIVILLAFLTFSAYGQAEFEKIAITENVATASTSKIVSQQPGTGELNYINATALPLSVDAVNALKLKSYLSTGLLKNGLLQANANTTLFDITAGTGIFSNFDNPDAPTSDIIIFPSFTGILSPYLTTSNITYVAINSVPAVVMQASPFTDSQRRDLIILGAIVHSNLTTINTINNISAPSNADTNQLHDLMEAIGALNISGNKYSANGANLSLNKSAGDIFKLGINFANNWKDPHKLTIDAQTLLTLRYRTQNGTEGSDVTVLNPAVYDLNNVLTAVPSNRFSIQTVTLFQSGITRVQYGQNTYATMAEAEAAINTRAYVVEPNIALNGIARAYIILKNSTTSLQNASDAKIVEAQKFGGSTSGGVALTNASIIAALGFTPENVANKDNGTLTTSATTYPTSGGVRNSIGYVTPEMYGAIGDGTTDDSTAFQNAINSGKMIFLSAKSYLLNYTINITSSAQILGSGMLSVLKTTSNLPVLNITTNLVSLKNFKIEGNGRGTSTNYATTRPLQNGVKIDGAYYNNSIENVTFNNLGGSGIYGINNQNGVSTNVTSSINVNSCLFFNNLFGINFDTQFEYNVVYNSIFKGNETGIQIKGGNNPIIGGLIINNRTGLSVQSGYNDAHSTANSVTINHNIEIGISVGAIIGGFTFTNCVIFFNPINLQGSTGVLIDGGLMKFNDFLRINNTISTTMQNIKFIGDMPSLIYSGNSNLRFFNNSYPNGNPAPPDMLESIENISNTNVFNVNAIVSSKNLIQMRVNGSSRFLFGSDSGITGGNDGDFNTYIYGDNNWDVYTNGIKRLRLSGLGATFPNLSGTGTRTVVADASGTLSTTGVGYKVYTALLSQTGTNAPTAIVQENTLGGTVTWSRVGNGSYRATLTGAFVLDKTTAQITGNNTSVVLAAYRANDDIVAVNTQTLDDSITKGTIEIRVYN